MTTKHKGDKYVKKYKNKQILMMIKVKQISVGYSIHFHDIYFIAVRSSKFKMR